MQATLTRRGVVTALALLVLATPGAAFAENVPLHQVPKPVLDAVAGRFAGARIAGAQKERSARGFEYEITIRHEGKNIDVTLTPEGELRLIKTELAAPDVPAPVVKALADAYPRATYDAVESVTTVHGHQETLAYYEVDLVTAQRRSVEVRVRADGRILGRAGAASESPR
jgi:hypothetical protein